MAYSWLLLSSTFTAAAYKVLETGSKARELTSPGTDNAPIFCTRKHTGSIAYRLFDTWAQAYRTRLLESYASPRKSSSGFSWVCHWAMTPARGSNDTSQLSPHVMPRTRSASAKDAGAAPATTAAVSTGMNLALIFPHLRFFCTEPIPRTLILGIEHDMGATVREAVAYSDDTGTCDARYRRLPSCLDARR
jgi:hypothetical protein